MLTLVFPLNKVKAIIYQKSSYYNCYDSSFQILKEIKEVWITLGVFEVHFLTLILSYRSTYCSK